MGFLEGLGKAAKYMADETVKTSDRQLKTFENECKRRGVDPNQSESTDQMKEKGFGR